MLIHWKDGCWNWSSNTLATWCKELTHWKRPWWKAGGEGDDRGWDGWMASSTQRTRVWANSWRWWRTGKQPMGSGILQSVGWQRVGHDWVAEQQNKLISCLLIKVFQSQGLEVICMIWLLLPLTSYHQLFAQLSSRPAAFLQKTKLCSDLGAVNFYPFSTS